MPTFAFAQFDVPGTLGIEDGRYLVRNTDGEGDDVIVVSSLRAPPRRRKRARRRPPDADAAPPADIPLTRATVVRATPLGDRRASRGPAATDSAPSAAAEEPGIWLDRMRRDAEARDAFAAEARALLNRALHVHAAAAMDPHTPQLGPQTPIATRIGYGDGDELVAGRWTEAIEAPPDPVPSSRRAEALRPQERLAAVLGAREEVPPYETLILRARLDLDNDRPRDAALQLQLAVSSLLAELGHEHEDLAFLQAQSTALASIRDEALTRTPSDDSIARLRKTLEVAERVLRRRRIAGDSR